MKVQGLNPLVGMQSPLEGGGEEREGRVFFVFFCSSCHLKCGPEADGESGKGIVTYVWPKRNMKPFASPVLMDSQTDFYPLFLSFCRF